MARGEEGRSNHCMVLAIRLTEGIDLRSEMGAPAEPYSGVLSEQFFKLFDEAADFGAISDLVVTTGLEVPAESVATSAWWAAPHSVGASGLAGLALQSLHDPCGRANMRA